MTNLTKNFLAGSLKQAALATALLLGAATPAAAQMANHHGAAKHDTTIVDVAVAAGTFKTLVAALQAADLVTALQGEGPFTVFAPSDAAFAKLPAGTVEALLKDPKALGAILTYHVIPGKVEAADVIKAGAVKPATLNGAALDIQVKDGKVYVNGATVTAADVTASNGVIHVIDAVVMPPKQ
ncbi:MAG: fasciclin domain-containing protein [Gemmatimonadales bacterium]|nr:fasciclin domain-containing protein [Gemmatimonadales bacterium]